MIYKNKPYMRRIRAIEIVNLILLTISGTLITWTWYNIITDDGDNMFLGLVMIILMFFTIYYAVLFFWGLKIITTKK